MVAEFALVKTVKVSYGEQILLETLTFIVPGLGTTTVVLGEGAESLKFLLNFERVEDKELNVATKVIDPHTLELTFTNWDNILGTGLLEPVEVGTFNDRRLSLLLFVRKVGEKGGQKMVTLSFYAGAKV